MSIMKRFIDNQLFNEFQSDFQFLFTMIRKSCGELDLRLRDNYFNLYYKGNSLAKVIIKKGRYTVIIHSSFVKGVYDGDPRIPAPMVKNSYSYFTLTNKILHPFFQVKSLKMMASNIKVVNNGEEITYEQMLITDNLENQDIVIIDRQITETSLNRRRLDLLGLKHEGANKYAFLILEVKLGNNTELSGKVAKQLDFYIKHVDQNFDDWKRNYELVYGQLNQLGIYPNLVHKKIEIIRPVVGSVIVVSYSGIAKSAISTLKSNYPEIIVKQILLSL